MKNYSILIPEYQENSSVFDLLGSSKMDVWKAAGRQAYADSPSLSSLIDTASSVLLANPEHIVDPELQDLVEYFKDHHQQLQKISREEFEEKYSGYDLEYDPNFTDQRIADILEERKQQEINDYIIDKGKGGFAEAIGKFGVEIVCGNLSPINIAASFIPIGGQARWLAASLKYGKLKTTLAKGFVGGSLGQAAIEPFMHYERKGQQRPYDLTDSIVNIVESGLFGSLLHLLGYSVKYLKDKYYLPLSDSISQKLRPEVATSHPVVDSQLKDNIESVLQESHPIIDTVEQANHSPIKELQLKKLELVTLAERQYPEYFLQQRKVIEYEQNLHQRFSTLGSLKNIPKYFLDNLLAEKAKLQQLHEKYVREPEFQHYLELTKELDQQVINNLRQQQLELNAYDLSPGDLYVARSQLDEGKRINLSHPQEAESFFHGDDRITSTVETASASLNPNPNLNLQEHLASLENEIASLPEAKVSSYQQERIKQDTIAQLTEEISGRIKQEKSQEQVGGLGELFKTLSLLDHELVAKLKTLHKEVTGQQKLLPLERNKPIEMFIADFKEQSFVKQRDIALNLIKQAEGERFIRNHANKVKGVREYLRQVDLRQETIAKELLFGLTRDLEKAGLISEFSSKEFESDIVQELWNITHSNKKPTISKRARDVAQIIHKWQTTAINRANLAGGYIIPLEGYITKQTHNSIKLRHTGYSAWWNFIDPLLDHDRTGTVDFKSIFNNLATETHLKDTDEYLNLAFTRNRGGNLASTLAASRKLHFKSAEGWLKYQQEFGHYSYLDDSIVGAAMNKMIDPIIELIIKPKSFIADSIVSNLATLGRSIGILETMGSHPERMLDNLREVFIAELQQEAANSMVNTTASLRQLNSLKRASQFNNQLDMMLGSNESVPAVSSILGAYRSWKCMANLGSTVISSFPDAASFVGELQNNGLPILKSYASLLQVATGSFNTQEKKEFGSLLGVGVDSLLGGSYARLGAEYPVAGSIAKATTAFFKLNCMEWWDNSWKSAMGKILSHNLARQINQSFSSLYPNLQNLLKRYGINENNWHLYKHLVQRVEDKEYLIPDIELLPDNIIDRHLEQHTAIGKPINSLNRTRLKQDLTNNLRRYLLDRVDTAIPTPHTAERNAMQLGNLGVRHGTPVAAVVQCLMQFKSFAYTYLTRPLKAVTIDQIPIHEQLGSGSLFDSGSWRDIAESLKKPTTLKILPQLLFGTTALGYLSINAARLLRGEELLASNEDGVFTMSLMKGGGLGLYGDFIFGEFDRYNHSLLESLAGPIGGDIIDIGKIYAKAKAGEIDGAKDLTKRLLKRNIAGRNLFYLQPALFMIP